MRVQKFLCIPLQSQLHHGAGLGLLHGGDAVFALAGRNPAHALIGGSICAAASDRDFLGHDERRIKPDAELTDELRILALIPAQPFEELPRSRACDGAEQIDDLVAAHADAIVGHGEKSLFRVHCHADRELGEPLMSSGRANASNRRRSLASDAFEMSSRRKISLLLYKEWTIKRSNCFTSAWNAKVVAPELSTAIARPN